MEFVQNSNEFDQHFLIDKSIIGKFVESCNINKNDIILEVGPGKGVITSFLCEKANSVICIELDERLKPYLDELQIKNPNLSIMYGNVLDIDLPEHTKLVTALPYSIIEPFIYKLSKESNEDITMIIGEKYADAVINNEITMLSLLTNCYFDTKKYFDITPDAFNPKPRVMSSVINLKSKEVSSINDPILIVFRWMFYYKDKKNRNALIESLIRYSEQVGREILTQRICKDLIKDINADILEEKFEVTSNKDLNELYSGIQRILTKIS